MGLAHARGANEKFVVAQPAASSRAIRSMWHVRRSAGPSCCCRCCDFETWKTNAELTHCNSTRQRYERANILLRCYLSLCIPCFQTD